MATAEAEVKSGEDIAEMSHNSILVVEDDPYQRRQMARVLMSEGHNVLVADSGAEAVRILEREKVSVVLTDRKMPLMDGLELARHVRTFYPEILVAMITAYPDGMDENGVDAVLNKPYSGQQLRNLVQSLLERSGV